MKITKTVMIIDSYQRIILTAPYLKHYNLGVKSIFNKLTHHLTTKLYKKKNHPKKNRKNGNFEKKTKKFKSKIQFPSKQYQIFIDQLL